MKKTCNFEKLLCNIAYYSIIALFIAITLIATYCSLKLFCPYLDIGSYAEFLTALVALFAFIVTLLEYLSSKDAKQAQVLSEYNKRYTEDPNIIKVVKYLNYIDKDGNINNPNRDIPSNYEVEMFMRFFEEIELQIRTGRLDDKDVNNLFVYYAYKLGKTDNQALRNSLGVTEDDYEKNWDGFKRIVENYDKFKMIEL